MRIRVHIENSEVEVFDKNSPIGLFNYLQGNNLFDLGLGLELEMSVEGDEIVGNFYKNYNYDFPILAKLEYS